MARSATLSSRWTSCRPCTWDVVHTAIRPAIAGALGVGFADASAVDGLDVVLSAGGSGATALASHTVKAGVRLGINASPEPLTNIAMSLLEDLLVAGVVTLALHHPVAAAVISGVLLAGGLTLVALIASRIRRSLRARQGRRGRPPP